MTTGDGAVWYDPILEEAGRVQWVSEDWLRRMRRRVDEGRRAMGDAEGAEWGTGAVVWAFVRAVAEGRCPHPLGCARILLDREEATDADPMNGAPGGDYPTPQRIAPQKPVVYIAGPYRAKTESGVFWNINRARQVAMALWPLDVVPVCPHLNAMLMGGIADDRIFLEGDMELLRRSDAVVTVEGWERGDGAVQEVAAAEAMMMPCFHVPLADWSERQPPFTVQRFLRWVNRWYGAHHLDGYYEITPPEETP